MLRVTNAYCARCGFLYFTLPVFLSAFLFGACVRTWAGAVVFSPPNRERAEAPPQGVDWALGLSFLEGIKTSSWCLSYFPARAAGVSQSPPWGNHGLAWAQWDWRSLLLPALH